MSESSDISGLWSGIYFYGAGDGVRFSAWIADSNGALTGTILEPNTFAPIAADELEAQISGTRAGQSVTFTKIYAASTGIVQPPLIYAGEANAEFTEVTGRWRLGAIYSASGPFRLSRLKASQSVAAENAVLVPMGL